MGGYFFCCSRLQLSGSGMPGIIQIVRAETATCLVFRELLFGNDTIKTYMKTLTGKIAGANI